MKYFFSIVFIISAVVGCSSPEVIITSSYIINGNWTARNDYPGANAIEIYGMHENKGRAIDAHSNPSQLQLLDGLNRDSSFYYSANVYFPGETSYLKRKVYFNKDNGFSWFSFKGEKETRAIGNLKPKSWYEFSNLKAHGYHYIVYVDSAGGTLVFPINIANY